jgi:hypothetical protein
MARKKLVLGEEYDHELWARVLTVLRDMGAKVGKMEEQIGGSQIVETVRARLGWRNIIVEGETYMGLSIEGDEADIDAIAARVAQRQTE